MARWFRVFGRSSIVPSWTEWTTGLESTCEPDETTWLRGAVRLGAGVVVEIERWAADEPGIRTELHRWAAYLETCTSSPHHERLMEWMIQTRQLYTLQIPSLDDTSLEQCRALCCRLAQMSDGVYQEDDSGFFSAVGTVLVHEP